jgi:hypothetical protein
MQNISLVFMLLSCCFISGNSEAAKQLSEGELGKIYDYSVNAIEKNGVMKDYLGCVNEGKNGDPNVIMSLFVIGKGISMVNDFNRGSVETLSQHKTKEEVYMASKERYKNADIITMKKIIGMLPKANKVCAKYESR